MEHSTKTKTFIKSPYSTKKLAVEIKSEIANITKTKKEEPRPILKSLSKI